MHELHSALVEGAEDAVITKGLDGRILSWNLGAERLYGWPAAEAIGRPITIIVPTEHAEDVWLIMRRIGAGERVEHYETMRRRRDGSLVNVSLTVSPVRDRQGAIVAASIIARDISAQVGTERIALAAEADERARLAEALHDDTIQAMTATLMLLDAAIETGDRAHLERARRTLANSLDRVRTLMFDLHPRVLDEQGLGPALNELATEVTATAGFGVSVDAPCTRFTRPVEELAYRTLREALLNAARHSSASLVRVRLWQEKGMLCGEVQDDGAGFDVESVMRRPDAGRHAGLASTAARVRRAGGRVRIDSAPGAGTTVHMAIVP
jgi:PAS domain S-box-containing protein